MGNTHHCHIDETGGLAAAFRAAENEIDYLLTQRALLIEALRELIVHRRDPARTQRYDRANRVLLSMSIASTQGETHGH